MNMQQRIEDLVLICTKMSALLVNENDALHKKKYEAIQDMVETKLALGHAYAKRMEGLINDEDGLKKIDPEIRGNLMDLGESLHDLMKENETLLSGSIEANRRFLDVVAQAVQEQRKDDAKTYSENGKENSAGSMSAPISAPISLDQNL
ncbi:MAG: flagellar export chaperone FlgN [Rhodospirillaceae bacterium]|nr:flagellar export chaperone FlgN [Rhodospirillaceae bacterium]